MKQRRRSRRREERQISRGRKEEGCLEREKEDR